MRHLIIVNCALAALIVAVLGWLWMDAPPPPTREDLCVEASGFMERVKDAPILTTTELREFLGSLTDAELALLHGIPAELLRVYRPRIDEIHPERVWEVLSLMVVECRNEVAWLREAAATGE